MNSPKVNSGFEETAVVLSEVAKALLDRVEDQMAVVELLCDTAVLLNETSKEAKGVYGSERKSLSLSVL